MHNKYLDRFYTLQEKNSFLQEQWLGQRQHLVEQYSWAIPNDEALDYIEDCAPILEMGAGKGYWAALLRDRGVKIEAFDVNPPDDAWTRVDTGTPDVISNYADRWTLLLCWPPYGDSMAYDSLQRHIDIGGHDIIYIGERRGGCTADHDFHQLLNERYVLAETIEIPSYEGIHDDLYHYVRKL